MKSLEIKNDDEKIIKKNIKYDMNNNVTSIADFVPLHSNSLLKKYPSNASKMIDSKLMIFNELNKSSKVFLSKNTYSTKKYLPSFTQGVVFIKDVNWDKCKADSGQLEVVLRSRGSMIGEMNLQYNISGQDLKKKADMRTRDSLGFNKRNIDF